MPFYFTSPRDLDDAVQWHIDDPALLLIEDCFRFWLAGFYHSVSDEELQFKIDPEPRLIEPLFDSWVAAGVEYLAKVFF